jgi:hypothetical protein
LSGTWEYRKLNVTANKIDYFYWMLGFYTKVFPSQEVLEIESNVRTIKYLDSFICMYSLVHEYNWMLWADEGTGYTRT